MTKGKRAIVLGGSVGGLCAAGALAPHYEQVVVIERDALQAGADHRRGVPQRLHPHFLLDAGRRAIEQLFPGLERDLLASGGLELNPGLAVAMCVSDGWMARCRAGATVVFASRVGIEQVLRERVRGIDNVRIAEQTVVRGLRTEGSPLQVTGVVVTDPAAGEQTLDTDVVIDAMGRGSSVHGWLRDAGGTEPPTLTLDAKATYSSRWYQRPEGNALAEALWWDQMTVLPSAGRTASDEHRYLATIVPVEGNRWIALLASWGLEMPRTNEEFEHKAGLLRAPAFNAALKAGTPISDVHVTHSTTNKWRRYDRTDNPPRGILFIGDSLCAFNPLYGQGMSAAAVTSRILREELDACAALDSGFYQRFYRRQADYLAIPWSMAIVRDRACAHAVGTEMIRSDRRRRLAARLVWPVFNFITVATREDAVIGDHFYKVVNMHESVQEMFSRPAILGRLVRYWVKSKLGWSAFPKAVDPLLDPPATDYTALLGRGLALASGQ